MDIYNFQQHSILAVVVGAVKVSLMVLLIQGSRIQHKAPLFGSLLGGSILIGIGALFKIMHWSFANAFLLTGTFCLLGVYALWFKAKSGVFLLDYLKLAWMIGVGLIVSAMALYHPLLKPTTILTEVLFWAMALLVVYQRWIRRPQGLTK